MGDACTISIDTCHLHLHRFLSPAFSGVGGLCLLQCITALYGGLPPHRSVRAPACHALEGVLMVMGSCKYLGDAYLGPAFSMEFTAWNTGYHLQVFCRLEYLLPTGMPPGRIPCLPADLWDYHWSAVTRRLPAALEVSVWNNFWIAVKHRHWDFLWNSRLVLGRRHLLPLPFTPAAWVPACLLLYHSLFSAISGGPATLHGIYQVPAALRTYRLFAFRLGAWVQHMVCAPASYHGYMPGTDGWVGGVPPSPAWALGCTWVCSAFSWVTCYHSSLLCLHRFPPGTILPVSTSFFGFSLLHHFCSLDYHFPAIFSPTKPAFPLWNSAFLHSGITWRLEMEFCISGRVRS